MPPSWCSGWIWQLPWWRMRELILLSSSFIVGCSLTIVYYLMQVPPGDFCKDFQLPQHDGLCANNIVKCGKITGTGTQNQCKCRCVDACNAAPGQCKKWTFTCDSVSAIVNARWKNAHETAPILTYLRNSFNCRILEPSTAMINALAFKVVVQVPVITTRVRSAAAAAERDPISNDIHWRMFTPLQHAPVTYLRTLQLSSSWIKKSDFHWILTNN